MLGVPPKSSGGATNRCVMSLLTKCAVRALFGPALSQAYRGRSAALISAPHQSRPFRALYATPMPRQISSNPHRKVIIPLLYSLATLPIAAL